MAHSRHDVRPRRAVAAPATAEQVAAALADPKLANVLYHDWEAATYDEKWSISYDERCISYARDRFEHVAGRDGWPYGTALELGCGTGFFLLNLKQGGVLDRGARHRPVAAAWSRSRCATPTALGFDVEGRVADAESIPYDDDTFDLVVGHAVLHHIPDLDLAMREVLRVLKPGGRFVFAGEPTQRGDWVARRLSRATWWAATRVTRLPPLRERWARPEAELAESSRAAALEAVVDLHTFDPDRLAALCLRAGADRRAHRDRGAHRVVVRLAGAHRSRRRYARGARLGLGDGSPTGAGCGCRGWTRTCCRGSCPTSSSTTSASLVPDRRREAGHRAHERRALRGVVHGDGAGVGGRRRR